MSEREERLLDLLEQWRELARQGRPRSEERKALCHDYPELREELEGLIRLERALEPRNADVAAGVPSTSPEAPPPPLDGYEILGKLGQGGMGKVYKARKTILGRVCALKVVHTDFQRNPTYLRLFQREIQAVSKLRHSNVIYPHHADTATDGLLFLEMEYFDGGENLADYLHSAETAGKHLSVREACEYVWQALNGLQHAHENGLVHRDLKPGNLLRLTDGTIKILDFGLAGICGEATDPAPKAELTKDRDERGESRPQFLNPTRTIVGTPGFRAPEQEDENAAVDIRADIYSLGCTLYCLLTGQRQPGPAPRAVRELRPDVPQAVADIVQKAMARSPDGRYREPKQMALALEPFAKGQDTRFTLPNFITGWRALLGVATAVALIQGNALAAVSCYFAGMVTDVLDGLSARLLKQVSAWGREFDAMADVILNVAAGVAVTWVALQDLSPANTNRLIVIALIGASYPAARSVFHRASLTSKVISGIRRVILFVLLWSFLDDGVGRIVLASCGAVFFIAGGIYEVFVSWEDWRTGSRPAR